MDKWEQIFFAVALAVFGWLLFTANKRANKSVTQTTSSSANAAPWYLSYNSSAGTTGQILNTGVTGGGIVAPNLSIGQDGSSVDNSSGWTLFPNWVQV
jgi:hypothetical protein